jgi:hypothetical protein
MAVVSLDIAEQIVFPRSRRGRRGNIATYSRGTDKERKVVRPPCFVNTKPGLVLPPPTYRVEKA